MVLYFRFASTFQLPESHDVSEKVTVGEDSFYAMAATGIKHIHRFPDDQNLDMKTNFLTGVPLVSLFPYSRAVKLIFTGGHISLEVAFKGPK